MPDIFKTLKKQVVVSHFSTTADAELPVDAERGTSAKPNPRYPF
jgi:hypothetical protein